MRPIVGDNAPMRAMVSIAVVLVLAGASAAGAAAQGSPAPPVSDARLQGSFLLAGHVTVARNIRGEHAGENVTRHWTFTSLCPSGQCQTVVLVRHRHAATDTVTLVRRSPGHYSGQGSFTAPLSCDGRTYPRGERIPFTITVRIDSAIVQNDTVVAGRLSATYMNATRFNRTPCVAALGHDAARYHGHLLLAPPT
jgi:hypothetical protein